MTCIIGLAAEGQVVIGADSICTDGSTRNTMVSPKVFRKGNLLLASAHSIRTLQILQYHVPKPPPQEPGQSDIEYLVYHIADVAREKLETLGALRTDNSVQTGDMEALIGYNGHIYSFQADFQVTEYARGLAAIGAGAEYALGAMLALAHLPARERVLKSLEIVGELSIFVAPPYYLECL